VSAQGNVCGERRHESHPDEAFGHPAEVLTAVDLPDVSAPAVGEVVIALEASPINPYDLLDSTENRKERRGHGEWHTACMAHAFWIDKGRSNRLASVASEPKVWSFSSIPQQRMTRRGKVALVIPRFPRSNACRPVH
jgi:hypothetical protein